MMVLNAGIMTKTYAKAAQGHDITFGVNFIGHFLSFHLLKSLLYTDSGHASRVVTLSSLGHLHSGPIDLPWITGGHNDEAKHDYMYAYHHLARRIHRPLAD
jgi:NAD(P)-dependent dehydrogenase (short-subunit alcohol dehydrogenase family)